MVDKNTETAGDLFAKVQKGGKATNIFKGKADDKTAGEAEEDLKASAKAGEDRQAHQS